MAIDVVSSTIIPCAVEVVWAYVTQVDNDVTWTSGLIEARAITSIAYGPGFRVERASKFLGRRFSYTIDVVEVEPLRRVEMKTSVGPFPMHVTYTLEPVEGGTRFSIRNRGDATGFFALAGGLLAGAVQRQVQLDVDTLRDLLAAR